MQLHSCGSTHGSSSGCGGQERRRRRRRLAWRRAGLGLVQRRKHKHKRTWKKITPSRTAPGGSGTGKRAYSSGAASPAPQSATSFGVAEVPPIASHAPSLLHTIHQYFHKGNPPGPSRPSKYCRIAPTAGRLRPCCWNLAAMSSYTAASRAGSLCCCSLTAAGEGGSEKRVGSKNGAPAGARHHGGAGGGSSNTHP